MTENEAVVLVDEKSELLDNAQTLLLNSFNLITTLIPQGKVLKFGGKVLYKVVKPIAVSFGKKILETGVNTVGNKIMEDVLKSQLTCLFFFYQKHKN